MIFALLQTNQATMAYPLTNGFRVEFEFQALNGTIVSTSAFEGKPVVLDWAASWCPTCKATQRSMNAIYDDYKDFVTFVSISYGGSGDDLKDVQEMKGNYEWLFGLDINNYADQYDVSNGYVWIIDKNLEIAKAYNYSIVSSSELMEELDKLIDPVTVTTTDESGSTIVTTTKPVHSTDAAEIEDNLDLGNNPFFIGFLAFSIVGIMIFLFLKQKSP